MNFAKIGKTIRRHRQELGITQKELAEAVGCCRFHIMSVEKGKTIPRFDKMEMIKRILQLPQDLR